ncbi:MAG: TrbC/VirB2 family protein [Pseudomonadota bacterium]|jgi:type IV secretion system protein VirB2
MKRSFSSRTASAALALMANLSTSSLALAQSANLDPAGSGVIASAAGWIQGTLLGNVATSFAVIAVGATGLAMLSGRIDWRRGITVIIGSFIVFGAAAIVAGIKSAASGSSL